MGAQNVQSHIHTEKHKANTSQMMSWASLVKINDLKILDNSDYVLLVLWLNAS